MRFLQFLLLTLGLCASSPSFAAAEEPPTLPGYSRVKLEEIKATVFKPDGWHVRSLERKTEDAPLAWQISLEDNEKLGGFKTGLTINVYDKVKERYGVKPSVFAAELTKRYAAKGEVETFKDGIQSEPFIMSRMRLRRTMKLLGQDTETMLVFSTIANDKTGTCYVFIFGTPVSDWPAHEKIIKEMSHVDIDDER